MIDELVSSERLASDEVEALMLAAIVCNPESVSDVTAEIPIDEAWRLTDPRARVLYPALVEHIGRYKALDVPLLRNELVRAEQLERVSEDFLRQVCETVPASDAVTYARLIREASVRRQLRTAATQIVQRIDAGKEPLERIIAEGQKAFNECLRQENQRIDDLVHVMLDVFQEIETAGGPPLGIPTGLTALDRWTGGLHPGELIVLAGRPGMGKSALAMNMLVHMTLHEDRKVLLISLEMGQRELATRTLFSLAALDARAAMGRRLGDAELARLRRALAAFDGKQLPADFTGALHIDDLVAKCRRLALDEGLDVLAVDYLQLLRSTRPRGGSRHEEVADTSQKLKALAIELQIPVVALAQLNRMPEQRSDYRPRLSDLRESGQIEQDADVVILLHRPGKYKASDPPDLVELIVAKQRNGPTGLLRARFDERTCRFSDWIEPATLQKNGVHDDGEL